MSCAAGRAVSQISPSVRTRRGKSCIVNVGNTAERPRAPVNSLLLPGRESLAPVYCWTWITVSSISSLTTLAY